MSQETIEWLNENTMIGFTTEVEKYANNGYVIEGKDGKLRAWWQQEDFRWAYEGAIPVEDVKSVLFNWEPVETVVQNRIYFPDDYTGNDYDGEDGAGRKFLVVVDQERKGIVHPRSHHVFGYFGRDTYNVHGYSEWLVDGVGKLVDSSTNELGIASAGLLRQGGVAYVCIQMPENVTTEAGLDIRPSILAATSIDGTKATTYAQVVMIPVCDNSLADAMNGALSTLKIKHSKHSLGRLGDARAALGLLYKQAEEMQVFFDTLTKIEVPDSVMWNIIERIAVVPEPKVSTTGKNKGQVTNQSAISRAENKRTELLDMWHHDRRCNTWNGTLLGAFQTVNTYNEHEKSRNDNGVERLMTGTLSGSFQRDDEAFWEIVKDVEVIDLSPLKVLSAA